MRLINAQSLELEDLPDSRLPRYAILSHTWEDDEVTFEQMPRAGKTDMRDPIHKRGYRKIRYACGQARKDRLSHVWVDTCCIDKKSSAELTEAINSMYRYYANAVVCYVFLADVLGGCPILSDDPFEDAEEISEWRIFFDKSKWFTRGWTLQELLAPQDVRFYGCEWNYIGKKQELTKTISMTTRIAPSILAQKASMSSISVAQRMAWAAHRQTSRVEDQAYCLLGIFDVNMPMLYGEGSKAFIRLQEEIIKTSTDHSIFAWEFNEEVAADGSLLAASPSNFAFSQKVVPWGKPAAFAITNRGLQMSVRTLTSAISEFETLAMLNCRYDDNLSETLALRLWKYKDNEDYHTLKINPGFVEPERTVSRLTRLTAPDAENREKPTLLQITRKFETNASKLKVWIEPNELCRLIDVYPKNLWTDNKRLMRTAKDDHVTGIVVVETSPNHRYTITFSIRQVRHWDEREVLLGIWGRPSSRLEGVSTIRLDLLDHRDYEGCRCYGKRCFDNGCPLMPTSLTIYGSDDREYLNVSIRMAKIMEDKVFVVTIGVNRPHHTRANDTRNAKTMAKMQNTNSVRAYQMQLIAEGIWFPLQHELLPSEAGAPCQVWMWHSSLLSVDYTSFEHVSPTRAQKLANHLLLWTFQGSGKYVKGLVVFSTPADDKVYLFFVGGRSIKWRTSVFCFTFRESLEIAELDLSRGAVDATLQLQGQETGVIDHTSLSATLPNDHLTLNIKLRSIIRNYRYSWEQNWRFALLVDIQISEARAEATDSRVPNWNEMMKDVMDESYTVLSSWQQTAFKEYQEYHLRDPAIPLRPFKKDVC